MTIEAAKLELSVADLLGLAFTAYRTRWQTLLRIAGFVAIPVGILTMVWLLLFLPEQLWEMPEPRLFGPPDKQPRIDPNELIGFGLGGISVAIAGLITTQVAIGACYREVIAGIVGAEPDKKTFTYLRGKLLRLVWLALILCLLSTIGLAACVIPGIFVFVYWVVCIPAHLSEGYKGRRALGRSYRLIHEGWWRTFACVLIVFFIASFVGQFLGAPNLYLLVSPENRVLLSLGFALTSTLGIVVFAPLYSAVAATLYLDARRRHEGWVDMTELAANLDLVPGLGRTTLFDMPDPTPQEAAAEPPPYWPPPPDWPGPR